MTTDEMGFARLVGVTKRKRRVVIPVALATAATGLLVVFSMPGVYQARAVVRLDDPQPGKDYVAPTVSEPVGDQLKSRRLAFLARPVVEDAAARAGRPGDAGALAAALDARQEGEDTFVLTVRDGSPDGAQRFLAALVDSFSERRAAESAQRARRTATFFGAEVDALRPKVAEREAALERFRVEHYGSLPEQQEGNMRMLDETQMETHSVRSSLDATLARQIAWLADARSPLRNQEAEAARALTTARARYTADSPEVKNLAAELERVRAERRYDEADLERRARRSPELAAMQVEAARLRSRLDELASRESELRGRVEQASRTGEALARLVLDRDLARERLKALSQKHQDAELAAALESSEGAAARVIVVEPAHAGPTPVAPARAFLAGGVLVLALALGVAAGLLADAADRRVRTVSDLRLVAGDLPVLGAVPRLDSRTLRAGRVS
jgi:uncharacterized protein involved in exopolysaccharide biosynthesis